MFIIGLRYHIIIAKGVRCNFIPDKSSYEVGAKFVDIYEDNYQAMAKHLKNRLK